jgi:PTS system mannose-specific IIB component
MGELVLVRIDDRLVHGQVMTAWLNYTGANKIVIVDDQTAKDQFMKSILEMVIPSGIKLEICGIEDGSVLLRDKLDGKDKVIVLVKSPEAVHGLVDKGVEIKALNIGGMGAKPGRQKLYKNITVSEEDKVLLKEMINSGVKVSVQIIPDEKEILVSKLI